MVFKKGHKTNVGRKFSDEAIQNMRHKHKHMSEIGKHNISIACKGRKPWNTGLTNYTDDRVNNISLNKARNNKISKAMKGRKITWSDKIVKTRKKNNSYRNVSMYMRLQMKERRRNMIFPTKDSSIEMKIQNFLKQLNIEFFTHQYMNIEHGYQCDIFIPSKNLVIECDGNYWHKYPIGNDIDHIRTSELLEKGFKVLRLWESEIKYMKVNDFKNKIIEAENGLLD
jgi:very-short-patch-repair endonuclease